MPNDLIPELITEIAKDFTEHLAIPDNSRILFSGKFGKGKTTFLEEYFKDKSPYNKSGISYNVFHLKPVNYSIASNEDIFRYIKYDIILEFWRKGYDPESYDFSFRDVLPYFILKHPEKIVKGFIEYIPKVGKLITEFLGKLKGVYEDVKTYRDIVNDSSPSNQMLSFLDKIELDEYSLYENDGITKLIEKILGEFKTSNNDRISKQNILIIDDLDRIDPEHIFRLLNVFSAHLHIENSLFGKENRFGFDKIILVCDVDNIRNIFGNKYGSNVDFKGYLDKFYSSDIFYFNNHFQLYSVSRNILMKTTSHIGKIGFNFFQTNQSSRFNFFELVRISLKLDLLSMRNIINFRDSPPSFSSIISFENEIEIDLSKFTFYIEVKALNHLFGSYHALLNAITRLQDLEIDLPDITLVFKNLVFIYYYKLHKFRRSEKNVSFTLLGKALPCQISVDYDGRFKLYIENPAFEGGSVEYDPSIKDYYILLKSVLADLYIEKFLI